jgi:hypothetical protein
MEITFWENVRRQRALTTFHENVFAYFSAARTSPDTDQAREARQNINRTMHEIGNILLCAKVFTMVRHTEPPHLGGQSEDIDLLLNVFELGPYRIPHQQVLDLLDRGLGVYQADWSAARLRTFNPFWWIGRGVIWFGRLPIWFLGQLGFNAKEIEGTTWGKIIKGVFSLLAAIGTLLTILNLLGLLDTVKRHLHVLK